jgi:Ca-activated chloride channel family protein
VRARSVRARPRADPARRGQADLRALRAGGDKLAGRPDDAIGLVAFASYAETRAPLTLDHGNLAAAARLVTFAREGESLTAIGAGLELAVQRLAEFKARSKVVILLTDGESNIHDIDEDTAIDDAVKAGVKVYTIGAGTTGVAPIRIPCSGGGAPTRPDRGLDDEACCAGIARLHPRPVLPRH